MAFNPRHPFKQNLKTCPIYANGISKSLLWTVYFLLFTFLVCTGCGYQNHSGKEICSVARETTISSSVTNEDLSVSVPEEIANNCMAIADMYKDMIVNTQTVKDETIEEIEAILVNAGYPTVVKEGIYPEYLANSEVLYDFWNQVTAKQDGEIGIVQVRENGGFSYLYFRSVEGSGQCYSVFVDWNADTEPYFSMCEELPVYDWELTENGTFYYQTYPPDCHYDDYARLLLHPIDQAYYDLMLTYIEPIGYAQNNMFYCDWSEQDFGELCFNDLFGYLYKLQTGRKLDLNQFSYNGVPWYYLIPRDLFEETITSYFSITKEALRNHAVYFESQQEYAYADNYLYFPDDIPDMIPMVTNRVDNPNGTFTLSVTVSSLERKTDKLFCHEITIRPLADGGFQYVSNRISYLTDYGLPPNYPRLPEEIR